MPYNHEKSKKQKNQHWPKFVSFKPLLTLLLNGFFMNLFFNQFSLL